MSKTFFGHPRGLATLFFTEMWERLSYYGMRALLVLFMTAGIAEGGLGFSEAKSGAIYGLYTCFVYLLALPGGWVADRIIGARRAIWYGGIIIMIGHFILAIPNEASFLIGLVFVVVGTGLLKPNVSAIVGDLYPDDPDRRDSGFYLFYMGINIGAVLGPLICGYLGEEVNWHLGFAIAGVGMAIGLIQYRFTQGYLGDIGLRPNIESDTTDYKSTGSSKYAIVMTALTIVLLAGLQLTGRIDLFTPTGLAEATIAIIVIIALAYFSYVLFAGGLSLPEKKKVIVIFVLIVAAAVFWSGFEQHGSSFNLFARDFADRNILGYEIPTTWFQSINPFFLITLAPVFGAMWIRLAARGLNPRTPFKFVIALFLVALGFWLMVQAAGIAAQGLKASSFFLIFAYFFHTCGELCLSPVGLSSMTKLAPKRYLSQMMGMWFVGTALGNLVAGLVAGRFDPDDLSQMPSLFNNFVVSGIGVGILILILSPFITKWMGDVK